MSLLSRLPNSLFRNVMILPRCDSVCPTLRDEPRRASHAVGSIATLNRFRDICGVVSDHERSGYQLRVFTRHSRIPRGVPSRPRLAWCGLDVRNNQAGLEPLRRSEYGPTWADNPDDP